MKNDNSQKNYRGFKYMMLAVLFFVAVGLAFFSRGRYQTDSRQAEVKGSAESMRSDVKQKGDILMATANEMEEGMRDTMDKSHDTVSEMASSITGKTDQMVESGTKTGTNKLMDRAKSVVNDVGDTMTGAAKSKQIASQAPEVSDTLTGVFSEAQDRMDKHSAVVPKVSEMAPKDSQAVLSSAEQAKASMGESITTVAPAMGSNAASQKEISATSLGRCPSPPARGQDLGNRYIVAFCETLNIISERTGVGLNDLINQNPQVGNPDLIYPNQELRLPPRG